MKKIERHIRIERAKQMNENVKLLMRPEKQSQL